MNTSIQIRLHEFQTTVVANVERTPKRRTARIIIDFLRFLLVTIHQPLLNPNYLIKYQIKIQNSNLSFITVSKGYELAMCICTRTEID